MVSYVSSKAFPDYQDVLILDQEIGGWLVDVPYKVVPAQTLVRGKYTDQYFPARKYLTEYTSPQVNNKLQQLNQKCKQGRLEDALRYINVSTAMYVPAEKIYINGRDYVLGTILTRWPEIFKPK